MVEIFVTFALLFPALMLLGLAFNGKPWAGLFSGMLMLALGVLMLGSGFQYGSGLTTNSTGYNQTLITLITYQNFTLNTSSYDSAGAFTGSVISVTSLPIYQNTTITNQGSRTSTSNYNQQKDTLTDALSILFMFLGLTILALSLLIIGKNKDVYALKIQSMDSD